MSLDFLSRKAYYLDHLGPIWNTLPAGMRGILYLTNDCIEVAKQKLDNPRIVEYIDGEKSDCGHQPILTASYGCAVRAADFDPGRPVILIEHGIGLTFGKPVFADGIGQRLRNEMALFPVPNQHTLDKCAPELRHKPHPIIGMPKMDSWAGEFKKDHPMPKSPTLAIALHHGDRNSRPGEIGSAWEYYIDILPEIIKRHKLIIHAHPIASQGLRDAYVRLIEAGAEYEQDFNQVMKKADIFINDCGSSAYEFAVTGKPVILLNAPWFNRLANWGIRFWEYTDIGPMVDEPFLLLPLVERTIAKPDEYEQARWRTVNDLFPFLGSSAERAVSEISIFLQAYNFQTPKTERIKTVVPESKPLKIRTSTDRGLLYMCFGEKALTELKKSIESLRNIGCDLPIAVVGNGLGPYTGILDREHITESLDWMVENVNHPIRWTGENPFDPSKANNFQFRAGRVKPSFYDLSPFKETMYVDADVEFKKDPEPGFGFLKHWDFCVAVERLEIGQLYNRPRAGWQHNIEEKDQTIQDFGGDGHYPFINSGVLFWKKNKAVEELFKLWSEEWRKWENWDEQMPLWRALHRSKVRLFLLSERWNYPHIDDPDALIIHQYGMGAARMDINDHEKMQSL